jgi:hypothetical protein
VINICTVLKVNNMRQFHEILVVRYAIFEN